MWAEVRWQNTTFKQKKKKDIFCLYLKDTALISRWILNMLKTTLNYAVPCHALISNQHTTLIHILTACDMSFITSYLVALLRHHEGTHLLEDAPAGDWTSSLTAPDTSLCVRGCCHLYYLQLCKVCACEETTGSRYHRAGSLWPSRCDEAWPEPSRFHSLFAATRSWGLIYTLTTPPDTENKRTPGRGDDYKANPDTSNNALMLKHRQLLCLLATHKTQRTRSHRRIHTGGRHTPPCRMSVFTRCVRRGGGQIRVV